MLKDDTNNVLGVLTQTIDPKQATSDNNVPFIFDIDVFIENVALDHKDEHFWEKFLPLRELKNKMFDLGLTDVAKKMFE